MLWHGLSGYADLAWQAACVRPGYGSRRRDLRGNVRSGADSFGEEFRNLWGPDFELVLFRCAEPSSASRYSEKAGSAIYFSVPDIRAAMTYLQEREVELLHSEPQPGDGLSYVAFVDPFGTVHEIVEYVS